MECFAIFFSFRDLWLLENDLTCQLNHFGVPTNQTWALFGSRVYKLASLILASFRLTRKDVRATGTYLIFLPSNNDVIYFLSKNNTSFFSFLKQWCQLISFQNNKTTMPFIFFKKIICIFLFLPLTMMSIMGQCMCKEKYVYIKGK